MSGEKGRNIPMQERLFRESENNRGLACPFKPIICEVGYCHQCEIYLAWQKLGELVYICAWCNELMGGKPDIGQPMVSHGICEKCLAKYISPRVLDFRGQRR